MRTAPSLTVSHQRRGSGPPLVLVHGLGSRWQVFAPVIDALAEHHDVIAVDLPGFGATALHGPSASPEKKGEASFRSSPPAALPAAVPDAFRPTPAAYAGWLAGWLASIGVERPHVVGNSMGGGIALTMARDGTAGRATAFSPIGFWRTPGRVWCQVELTAMRTLARVGGPAMDRALGVRPLRVASAAGFFGHPSRVSAEQLRADTAALVAAPAFPAARDGFTGYVDDGRPFAVPVTVAWGTRDVLLTHRTQAARARAQLPEARHVDLPGCGHLPFHDDPDACVRVVLEDA